MYKWLKQIVVRGTLKKSKEGQNDTEVLNLYRFVSEEFNDNDWTLKELFYGKMDKGGMLLRWSARIPSVHRGMICQDQPSGLEVTFATTKASLFSFSSFILSLWADLKRLGRKAHL